jgi:hypothetical protein
MLNARPGHCHVDFFYGEEIWSVSCRQQSHLSIWFVQRRLQSPVDTINKQ